MTNDLLSAEAMYLPSPPYAAETVYVPCFWLSLIVANKFRLRKSSVSFPHGLYRVVLSLSARADLRDIVRYISFDAPERALSFGLFLIFANPTSLAIAGTWTSCAGV